MSIAYSTMPCALRGASSMSWMTAFWESRGSTSPNARPTSLSYVPTAPNEAPPNVGDSTRVISMRTIRASAGRAAATISAAPTNPEHANGPMAVFIVSSSRAAYEIRDRDTHVVSRVITSQLLCKSHYNSGGHESYMGFRAPAHARARRATTSARAADGERGA